MKIDNKQLLEQYSKGLASTGKTRSLYLRYASDFLDYAEGDFSREVINKYLERLKRKKYRGKNTSDGTLNFAFRVVRTLFTRNEAILKEQGVEWPYRRGESPSIREDDINAPALDPDIIREQIYAIKKDGEPAARAFLSISTVYGTRRIEMVELTQDDVRIKDKTIHIATAKHGRERTHLIPDEIVPYLAEYDFNKPISDFTLFTLWYRIEYKISLAHTDQVGWHSIRRTLNTLLLDQLPEATVMGFMRWKQRTSSHMPYRYSAQRYVGREGVTTKVVGEAKDVDTKVFEVHPFLEHWK